MCLSKEQSFIKTAIEAHQLDGSFNHDDIIRHLAYAAEAVSADSIQFKDGKEPDGDDMQSAIINLTAMVQAVAYIALMRDKMKDLRKGGASC